MNKILLSLLLCPVVCFAEEVNHAGTTYATGSHLTLQTGVNVTGLIVPSGTPSAGNVAIFSSANSVRNATAQEVFNYSDPSATFLPVWSIIKSPPSWVRGIPGAAFEITGTDPATIDILFSGLDMTGAQFSDLPGLQDALDAKPTIVAKKYQAAKTAADASFLTYTVGSDGDHGFQISAYMDVTVATTIATTVVVGFTDEASGAHSSYILPMTRGNGNWLSGGQVVSTGNHSSAPVSIRCLAGSTITIGVTAGTFTSVTYNLAAIIKQVQ